MQKRGFTLIELLIVVAIIAILAAIAVPNFLEAQMRAKVSRFMADAKTCATALEAYRVDSNMYPPPEQVPIGADFTVTGPPWPITGDDPAANYLPTRITTPVAYLTSLPMDTLGHIGAKEAGLPQAHQPHYVNDDFNSRHAGYAGDPSKMYMCARTKAGLKYQADPPANLYDRSVTWHLHSHGPDGDHDDYLSEQGYPTAYDPTNGTKSDGDIFYFGPGRGFTSN